MKSATQSDWETLPLPEQRATIELDLRFTPEEFEQIKRGVIPEEMEDKWFIYLEDDKLHFHRSWTGFCVYVVTFTCDDDGATAVEADLNRDPEQYKNADDQYDAEMIAYIIDVVLLRKPSHFPSKSSSDSKRALEQWSQVGEAGLGIHPGDDRPPRFVFKTKCHLCVHKFGGHTGCMAFPEHLPHELASGDRMHDEEFPGDRGYRFEKRGNRSRERCPHLYKGKQVVIPLERVLKDAYACSFNMEPTVDLSYEAFTEYFERVDAITAHELVIGAGFVFSWMPASIRLGDERQFAPAAAYLDAVRLGNDLDNESISIIGEVLSRSVIGSSKLLHFVSPERYPIIDRPIDTYLNGQCDQARLLDVNFYMSYTCACRRAVEDPRFEAVYQHVNKSLGYDVTALRALELIMSLSAMANG